MGRTHSEANRPALPYFLNSEEGQGKQFTLEDYTDLGRLHELLDVTPQRFFDLTCEILNEHALEFELVEGAEEGVGRLSELADLDVVTSRSTLLRPITQRQVEHHFGKDTFKAVILTGGRAAHIPPVPKWRVGRKRRYDAFGDDSVSTSQSNAMHGIRSYLFGEYTWNSVTELLHPNVVVTPHWSDLVAEVERLREELGAD